jgi:hypothetical protein
MDVNIWSRYHPSMVLWSLSNEILWPHSVESSSYFRLKRFNGWRLWTTWFHQDRISTCRVTLDLQGTPGTPRISLATMPCICNFGKRQCIGTAVNAGSSCNTASVPVSAVCRENLQSKTGTYFSCFHRSDYSLDALEMKPVSSSVKWTSD